MRKLFHSALFIPVSVGLGALLLYASYHKITDPPDFAKLIYQYKLVPPQLINLLAIYLPWVEVLAGCALITGIGRRGGAFLASVLFVVFIAALSYNLYRGCPTLCGCFDTYREGQHLTDAEKFAKMRLSILRDIGLLVVSTYVFAGTFIRKR